MRLNGIRYFIAYVPFYFVTKFVLLLSRESAVLFGRIVGGLYYIVSRKYRQTAARNIQMALRMEEGESKKMALSVFKNVGATFAEAIRLSAMSEADLAQDVEVEGYENFLTAREAGKGVFLLSAHLGNWEVLGATHSRLSGSTHAVFKKNKNPYIDRFINSTRESHNITPIYRRNSARKIIAALKKGGTMIVLPDLHSRRSQSYFVDFFGVPAATNYGMALLSLRTGAPIVPAFAVRGEDGRYRCIYDEPIYLKPSGDMNADIAKALQTFNSVIEKQIRNYPDQWYWVNDRWKSSTVFGSEERKPASFTPGTDKATPTFS